MAHNVPGVCDAAHLHLFVRGVAKPEHGRCRSRPRAAHDAVLCAVGSPFIEIAAEAREGGGRSKQMGIPKSF